MADICILYTMINNGSHIYLPEENQAELHQPSGAADMLEGWDAI